jgi:hypothetical protein
MLNRNTSPLTVQTQIHTGRQRNATPGTTYIFLLKNVERARIIQNTEFNFFHVCMLCYTEEPKKCEGPQNIYTVPPPFSLNLLPFDEVALAFMQLAPPFGRISHYTSCITFLFNFVVVSVSKLYEIVCTFCWSLCIYEYYAWEKIKE